MCVLKESAMNRNCRPGDHLAPKTQRRFSQPAVSALSCVPGSPGWIGDRCTADAECQLGTTCALEAAGHPGICTVACNRVCPDQPGWPWTFCANEPTLGGGSCLRRCTPSANANECPADSTCVSRPRAGEAATTRAVCVPR